MIPRAAWAGAAAALACGLFGALYACGGSGSPTPGDPEKLSEFGLFTGPIAEQRPAPGVVPFEVSSPLFSDDARKLRFIRLPAGAKIAFDATNRWTFPDGTTLVKTFYYDADVRDPRQGRRLVETRLLIKKEGAWTSHVYLWNDAQTEAERFIVGKRLQVSQIGTTGTPDTFDYLVPNTAQCRNCHGNENRTVPLGPRTRQLNRTHDYGQGQVNQLEHFASLGMFSAAIPPVASLPKLSDPRGTDSVEARARSYLDANCGHCHQAGGLASSTGLRLNHETTDPIDLGVCRRPIAAGAGSGGFSFDVVPGKPEESIVIYRMSSVDPAIKMPELPTLKSDESGVELVRQWIAAMTPVGCP